MEGSNTVWSSVLDQYERALADANDRSGHAQPFIFAFPSDLGPLPPEFAARAGELVEFAHAIERGVAAAMTKAQAELAATAHTVRGHANGADRPAPRFIDTAG